jgi:acyl carrier protein
VGLEIVEIVMELEDHFGVRLEDDAMSRTRTVGDLARLVTERLPMVEAGAVCLTARTFYQVRGVMEAEAKLPRRVVRPSAKLEEILPRGQRRRAVWRAMSRELRNRGLVMAGLTWSRKVKRHMELIHPAMLVVWVFGSFTAFLATFWWLALTCMVLVLPALIVIVTSRIHRRFEYELPDGVETVGDLVRRMVPRVVVDTEEQREAAGVKVLQEVREILARQLNMNLEDVRAESRLVEDLRV